MSGLLGGNGASFGYAQQAEHNRQRAYSQQRAEGFWMVFVEGGSAPVVKHDMAHNAKNEAKRLARATGKRTYILLATESYEVADIKVTPLELPLPF